MTHLGVDLSSFQGTISPAQLAALKAAGVDFAFVKATQGGGTNGYTNPDAPQQVKALRSVGIHVGLYHYVTVNDTVSDQVQHFLPFAQALGGSDLPLALDCETHDPAGWTSLAWKMVAIAMQVEAEPTVVRCPKAMFYVDLNFYENLPGFPWGRLVWLADPNPGAPHKPCLVLQSAPRPEGGFTSIDPDTFLGTEGDWNAFITSGAAPGPTPAPTPTPPAPKPTPTPVTNKEFDVATLPNITIGSTPSIGVVKSIQALLRDKANQTSLGVNGNYGVETIAAVKAVQHLLGRPETGEVDEALWEFLLTAA